MCEMKLAPVLVIPASRLHLPGLKCDRMLSPVLGDILKCSADAAWQMRLDFIDPSSGNSGKVQFCLCTAHLRPYVLGKQICTPHHEPWIVTFL